jgi:hypothetical protein
VFWDENVNLHFREDARRGAGPGTTGTRRLCSKHVWHVAVFRGVRRMKEKSGGGKRSQAEERRVRRRKEESGGGKTSRGKTTQTWNFSLTDYVEFLITPKTVGRHSWSITKTSNPAEIMKSLFCLSALLVILSVSAQQAEEANNYLRGGKENPTGVANNNSSCRKRHKERPMHNTNFSGQERQYRRSCVPPKGAF